MELIICFLAVISVFAVLIVSVVGLVNAPTPILLVILVAGMMLTQKSINKFNQPEVNFIDDRQRNGIEKVEINSTDNDKEKTILSVNKSMVYRGSSYNRK